MHDVLVVVNIMQIILETMTFPRKQRSHNGVIRNVKWSFFNKTNIFN